MKIPAIPEDFSSGTTFCIYDPVEQYTLDHFGPQKTLKEFWTNCWKPPQHWDSRVKRRCIGLRFDGGVKPKLLQVYFYGYWNRKKN